jgi:hypothetical protein
VNNVANDGTGRGRHHAYDLRHKRQWPLASRIEQAFRREGPLALFEQRHQRAFARQLQAVDDDLVLGAAGVGRHLARGDDFGAVLRPEGEPAGIAAPDHCVDARGLVLQREIAMARAVALEAGNLAANADVAELAFDDSLHRARELADRQRRRIVAGRHVG